LESAPEDETPVKSVAGGETEGGGEAVLAGPEGAVQRAVITIGGAPASSQRIPPRMEKA
jgi:hypothetical protein